MMEELICICGKNIFKVSRDGTYVLCVSCGEVERVDILARYMENAKLKEQD